MCWRGLISEEEVTAGLFEGIKLEVYMLIVRRDTGVPDEQTAFLLPGV